MQHTLAFCQGHVNQKLVSDAFVDDYLITPHQVCYLLSEVHYLLLKLKWSHLEALSLKHEVSSETS